jgi:hypothetical protein
VCATEVGFSGMRTPASESDVGARQLTYHCEWDATVLLRQRHGINLHDDVLDFYPSIVRV